MMVRNFLGICHIVCALVISAAAGAAERGTSVEIDKFLAGYTRDLAKQLGPGARIEYSASTLAASAETRSCAAPLAISTRDQTQSLSRVTLFVACGNEWSIYVPVDLHIQRPMVVAIRPLASGAVVAAEDVELSPIDVGQLAGTYLTTLDDAIGMGVKRPITQGRPIFSQQLEPPLLIRRGEAVVISAEAGALAVKMAGTAMTDGHRGEQIRVKNQTTSRIIDARVTAPGQVAVAM